MHSYLCTKVAQSLNRPTIYLSIEQYMTRCTLFCDYCEILRNKHVGLFKIGLNWT